MIPKDTDPASADRRLRMRWILEHHRLDPIDKAELQVALENPNLTQEDAICMTHNIGIRSPRKHQAAYPPAGIHRLGFRLLKISAERRGPEESPKVSRLQYHDKPTNCVWVPAEDGEAVDSWLEMLSPATLILLEEAESMANEYGICVGCLGPAEAEGVGVHPVCFYAGEDGPGMDAEADELAQVARLLDFIFNDDDDPV